MQPEEYAAISIHSLRVEGDIAIADNYCLDRISIHSLRVEGDPTDAPAGAARRPFQSTPSVWRETRTPHNALQRLTYFNPLPPCGGRRISIFVARSYIHFNPLPPCGGRPAIKSEEGKSDDISIHSLRVEGDRSCSWMPQHLRISIHSLRVEGDDFGAKKILDVYEFQSTPSVWRETP